jgi:hypothetical protein
VAIEPDNSEFLVSLGAGLLRGGKTREAQSSLQKAIDVDERSARAHLLLGILARRVVLRSCSPDDSTLNYAKDSLVHYFVASDEAGRGWRLAGPVVRDYSVGECTPASPG